jgi:hypothetical protein
MTKPAIVLVCVTMVVSALATQTGMPSATICLVAQPPAPTPPHTRGPGPCQIKGVIRDMAKQPIAGVGTRIEDVSGSTFVNAHPATNSQGNYSAILQRIAGKYRVSPVGGGYRFAPASVEVSGSGGTVNFTGTRTR